MASGTDAERIVELEEDNRRLRRLLEQSDAPSELRHRLRSTLSLLRSVIRKSAGTGRYLSDYIAQLEDRLDAIIRAQALADQHGEVDLRMLLTDELFQYQVSEGDRLLLTGPDVRLQPKVGQVLALALHELAVNAVEHGVIGVEKGHLAVSWDVAGAEPETSLLLSWTEINGGLNSEPVRHGFGTEVLTRMLPYELGAETKITSEPSKLCCTICFPLPKWVGRVARG